METFNAMHEEGNIGAFGASNWTHTRIEEANEYAYKHNLIPFSVSSPNFCLARQIEDPWGGGCVNISGPENIEARAWYEKKSDAGDRVCVSWQRIFLRQDEKCEC